MQQGNQSNHVELDCSGGAISASINGTQVASVQDSTYAQGRNQIAAGPTNANTQHIATDVRLDNLTITGTPPPPGTVLASDKLNDAGASILAKSSSMPDQWQIGYANGEYQIATVKPALTPSDAIAIPGTYADVSVGLDAHLASGSDASTAWIVGCRSRRAISTFTGYDLYFIPSDNTYGMIRRDADTSVSFTNPQKLSGPPFQMGTHHLQLTCSGSTITGSIDGVQVSSVQDSTYPAGQAFLGAGLGSFIDTLQGTNFGGFQGNVDVRFSNLVLTQP